MCTVSAPCNHFVSQKALLSSPHRRTGRGWIGKRHLTPFPAFFPPFPIQGFALHVGQALVFSLLSLSTCFNNCPERVKGIREMLQESSKAGENVLPEAGAAQQSAITQWEEKAVQAGEGFPTGTNGAPGLVTWDGPKMFRCWEGIKWLLLFQHMSCSEGFYSGRSMALVCSILKTTNSVTAAAWPSPGSPNLSPWPSP